MTKRLQTVSPIDGSVYVERELASTQEIDAALNLAVSAQRRWRTVAVADRVSIARKAIEIFRDRKSVV